MQEQYANIVLNYNKETKHLGSKIGKELKSFVNKYGKMLALTNQKEIEINILPSDKLEVSVTKRMMNVRVISGINVHELTTLIENKILAILEADKVFVPDYIKEQVNNTFNLKKKMKINEIETNKIIEDIDKSKDRNI